MATELDKFEFEDAFFHLFLDNTPRAQIEKLTKVADDLAWQEVGMLVHKALINARTRMGNQ